MKPEKWTSADFLELSPIGRLCFEYMQEMCDDEGLIKASVRSLRVTACNNISEGRFDPSPYDEIQHEMTVMARQRMILPYSFGVDDYVWVVNFVHHQNVDRASSTILPRPPKELVISTLRDCNVRPATVVLLESWGIGDFSTNNSEETRVFAPGSGSGSISTSSLRSEVSGADAAPDGSTPGGRTGKDRPPPTPSYRAGYAEFVGVLNEACGRRFQGSDPQGLAKYTALRRLHVTSGGRQGMDHAWLLNVARGAALDPNRIENPQYQSPVSVLRSSILEQLAAWGSGDEPAPAPRTALATITGGGGAARPHPVDTRVQELADRAADKRAREARSAGA